MARLLLAGYFGCGNLGDDAILLGFMNGIGGLSHEVQVLAGNVEDLTRRYGLPGIHRKDYGAVTTAIRQCDALVFPGGSVFQDATSVRSVAYYSRLVSEAKKAGKRVVLLGQGVGPLTSFFGKRWAGSAFNAADLVVVRDQASVGALQALGYRGRPIVAADTAFLLPEPPVTGEATAFGAGGSKSVGVSARPFGKDKGRSVVQIFAELARLLNSNGFIPTFIEMDRDEDGPLILEIAKTLGGKVPDMRGLAGPRAAQERIARMHGVIAMRLHAGVLAATVGVPAYMVSYDPKVTAFANAIGSPAPPTMQGLTAQRVFDGFVAYLKDRDRAVAALRQRTDDLRRQAQTNVEALASALPS